MMIYILYVYVSIINIDHYYKNKTHFFICTKMDLLYHPEAVTIFSRRDPPLWTAMALSALSGKSSRRVESVLQKHCSWTDIARLR